MNVGDEVIVRIDIDFFRRGIITRVGAKTCGVKLVDRWELLARVPHRDLAPNDPNLWETLRSLSNRVQDAVLMAAGLRHQQEVLFRQAQSG